MSFNITSEMKGLLVFNATEGVVLGTTGRVAFDRRTLRFKHWAVLNEGEGKTECYLRFSDILRVNEKAVLCFFEQSDDLAKVREDDGNVVYFVGNSAVSSSMQSLGVITSAQLDSLSGEILSFSIQQGNKSLSADKSRILSFADSCTVVVDCAESDFMEANPPIEAATEKTEDIKVEGKSAERQMTEPILQPEGAVPEDFVQSDALKIPVVQTETPVQANASDYILRQPVHEGNQAQGGSNGQIHIGADIAALRNEQTERPTPPETAAAQETVRKVEEPPAAARGEGKKKEQKSRKAPKEKAPRKKERTTEKHPSGFWKASGFYTLGGVLFTGVYAALVYFQLL